MKKIKRSGFTLIEIVIVLAVLGMVFGMLLHSFIVSIKMNKDAINMDMARTLAESKVEELKDVSPSKFSASQEIVTKGTIVINEGEKDYKGYNINENIYYDINWQETTTDAAIFQLESNITKTAIEDKMNVFKPNTYLEGKHRHNMIEKAPYTLIVIAPNGAYTNEREYFISAIDSEINDKIVEIFTEEYNENSVNLSTIEKFNRNIRSIVTSTTAINQNTTDRNGDKYDMTNTYYIGKNKTPGVESTEKGKIAERIDNKEFLESLPVKVYFYEKKITRYADFKIQILNLTDRNIDFYIDYERDFTKNRNPKDVLEAEVVGGLSTPFQTGNVNIIYTYTRQKNNSDTYKTSVKVKDLRDNSEMISLENNKYDNLYER